MIIPKRDAKCYGAVHIDNYLTFTGFCKKVDSDELCDIDVFMDGKKIDTLKADKRIAKVEEIYDIEGHGFLFELEEKYFDKTHTLEFKASSGEELVNSKIQTIDKNHPKFNEYRFLHSLSNVDVEKIKDLYCPNSIGFLATEENLNDKDFVEYIKELMERFPDVEFKAFCFNDEEKEFTKNIFIQEIDRVKIIQVKNIYEIAKNIKIFIYSSARDIVFRIVYNMISSFTNIHTVFYNKNFKNILLKEYDKNIKSNYMNTLSNPHLIGINSQFIEQYDGRITEILINFILAKVGNIEETINPLDSVYENRYIKELEYILKYDSYIIYKKDLDNKIALLEGQ